MLEVIRGDLFRGVPFNTTASAYEVTSFDGGMNELSIGTDQRHRAGHALTAVLEGRGDPGTIIVFVEAETVLGKRVLAVIGTNNTLDADRSIKNQGTQQVAFEGNEPSPI